MTIFTRQTAVNDFDSAHWFYQMHNYDSIYMLYSKRVFDIKFVHWLQF